MDPAQPRLMRIAVFLQPRTNPGPRRAEARQAGRSDTSVEIVPAERRLERDDVEIGAGDRGHLASVVTLDGHLVA